jgi:hypothetical protein
MAEEGNSDGGSGIIWGILIVLIILVINVPIVSEIIFQWIPATVDVISGRDSSISEIGSPIFDEESQNINTESEDLESQLENNNPTVLLTSSEDEINNLDLVSNEQDIDPTLIYHSDSILGNNSRIYNFWTYFVPISIFISLLLIIGLIYIFLRMYQIRKREQSELIEIFDTISGNQITSSQKRWKEIVDHSQSINQNDWRAAIIEADIMLDELLDAQGYKGDTMGEKMKQIERSDFNSIDAAWEAHKARNLIAHEGSGYELNQREIRRIVELYERVFREFHFI